MPKLTIFWFRRDLRFQDNTALYYALKEGNQVLPIFIFDRNILDKLEDRDDPRVDFIHQHISGLKQQLKEKGSDLEIFHSTPKEAFEYLLNTYQVESVFTNRDYEPYAEKRDAAIEEILKSRGVGFYTFKDHVIFEKDEIVSGTGSFYKVFTPYSRAWRAKYEQTPPQSIPNALKKDNWLKFESKQFPSLESMGFQKSTIQIPGNDLNERIVSKYDKQRDYPALDATSRMGIHLRFGTISIRELAARANTLNYTYLNELIWREFYIMILANYPQVTDRSFKPAYDQIPWRDDEEGFKKWCLGKTGYPIVDAGMRQLNQTGYMHNRVRMIVASFLTKHLLIDWRWGEAYFARKLLDFELASNNGGWQWAAGTGTDAQPYFRVFNPQSQTEKFDPNLEYIKKWIPEYGTDQYPAPMVEHKFARQRAIDTYKSALGK